MGRWQPDARDRLEHAALELFSERGFDAVTVAQITARAGLTTRTFFRHFADKREVLFAEADQMPELAAKQIRDLPPELGPADVMAAGMSTLVVAAFEGRHADLRRRKAVVDGHDGLRERELRKMERLVSAIAEAFRERGVDDVTAAVVAETGVGIVKVSLGRWIDSDGDVPLHTIVADALARLGDAFDRRSTADGRPRTTQARRL